MTAVSRDRDRVSVQCCGCGKKFTIPKDSASDLSILNVACPHCGRHGILSNECTWRY